MIPHQFIIGLILSPIAFGLATLSHLAAGQPSSEKTAKKLSIDELKAMAQKSQISKSELKIASSASQTSLKEHQIAIVNLTSQDQKITVRSKHNSTGYQSVIASTKVGMYLDAKSVQLSGELDQYGVESQSRYAIMISSNHAVLKKVVR